MPLVSKIFLQIIVALMWNTTLYKETSVKCYIQVAGGSVISDIPNVFSRNMFSNYR